MNRKTRYDNDKQAIFRDMHRPVCRVEREEGGGGVGAKHNTHRVRCLPERANEHNCLTGFPPAFPACLVFCLSIMSRRPSHAASISIVAMVPSLPSRPRRPTPTSISTRTRARSCHLIAPIKAISWRKSPLMHQMRGGWRRQKRGGWRRTDTLSTIFVSHLVTS